jgi:hypothetical protein
LDLVERHINNRTKESNSPYLLLHILFYFYSAVEMVSADTKDLIKFNRFNDIISNINNKFFYLKQDNYDVQKHFSILNDNLQNVHLEHNMNIINLLKLYPMDNEQIKKLMVV